MSLCAYDPEAIELLTEVLSGALESYHKAMGSAAPAWYAFHLAKKMTQDLLQAYDQGERDPAALRQIALHSVGARH